MKLSKTEARILSTLEQANGEVVSRHAFGLTSESNTLEVLICRLRKKGWSIKAVRGAGYKLGYGCGPEHPLVCPEPVIFV